MFGSENCIVDIENNIVDLPCNKDTASTLISILKPTEVHVESSTAGKISFNIKTFKWCKINFTKAITGSYLDGTIVDLKLYGADNERYKKIGRFINNLYRLTRIFSL